MVYSLLNILVYFYFFSYFYLFLSFLKITTKNKYSLGSYLKKKCKKNNFSFTVMPKSIIIT